MLQTRKMPKFCWLATLPIYDYHGVRVINPFATEPADVLR
jgi:hypothetical protein